MNWQLVIFVATVIPAVGAFLDTQHFDDAQREGIRRRLGRLRNWIVRQIEGSDWDEWRSAIAEVLKACLGLSLAFMVVFFAALWLRMSVAAGTPVSIDSVSWCMIATLCFRSPWMMRYGPGSFER